MGTVLAFCLKNWRLFAYAAAAIAALWLALLVRHWHADSLELPKVQAALKAEVACTPASECGKRVAALQVRQAAISQTVVTQYEQELSDLRSRPVPVRVIRVCRPTSSSGVRVAGSAEGPSATETGGVLLESREFDTGPLRRAAAEADELNAAYRLLYNRDDALSKVTTK